MAIQLNSNNAFYYDNRAYVKMESGKYVEAIEDFNRAIDLNPDIFEFHFYRGDSFFRLKKFQEALIDYSMAIKIDPKGNSTVYNNRGSAYFFLK